MRQILMLAASLSIAACATNRPPERQVVQHPPVADVANPRCLGQEPAALTDEQLAEDFAVGSRSHHETDFDAAMVDWGRTCEAALSRVCTFHTTLGLVLPPELHCDTRRHP